MVYIEGKDEPTRAPEGWHQESEELAEIIDGVKVPKDLLAGALELEVGSRRGLYSIDLDALDNLKDQGVDHAVHDELRSLPNISLFIMRTDKDSWELRLGEHVITNIDSEALRLAASDIPTKTKYKGPSNN